MTAPKTSAVARSKIPWVFVGFFLAVFAANGAMIAVALSTWTGLETDTAYEDGLAYNDRLSEREAQKALGWQVALALEPAVLAVSAGIAGAGGLAVVLTFIVHSARGTPEPVNSTLPTLALASVGFLLLGIRARRLRAQGEAATAS